MLSKTLLKVLLSTVLNIYLYILDIFLEKQLAFPQIYSYKDLFFNVLSQ